jgi:hypothetical protein
LEISNFCFSAPDQPPDADFAAFCATPLLSQLTSLRLHHATYVHRVSLPPLASLEAGLPLLSRLHTLELSFHVLTNEVLSVFAARAPSSLRRLSLLYLPPQSPHYTHTCLDHFTRDGALRLHESKPHLLLYLVLPRSARDWSTLIVGADEPSMLAWQFNYLSEHLRTMDTPVPLPNIRRHELGALNKPLCWCSSPLTLRDDE